MYRNSVFCDELYSLSFDSIEEDGNNAAWFGLVQNLSYTALEKFRNIFKEHKEDGVEIGLGKVEFLEAITSIYGNSRYSLQSNMLFDDIVEGGNTTITWNDFLDFLIENLSPKSDQPVSLNINRIESLPHMNRETIIKIVLIETEKYFCYAAISKHGRVGLYDGNLNFLTSYQAIMSVEDISRSEDERRRRNRWVTDAIFCSDVQMMIVTNSARSITIYEASGLGHVPYWLVVGVPEIIECMAYKCSDKPKTNGDFVQSILFWGDFKGDVISCKFLQPHKGLLRRKHPDRISVFYWKEMRNEKSHIKIDVLKRVHNTSVRQIEYYSATDEVISCSRDPKSSMVKQFLSHKSPYIFKMPKGCNCFSSSNLLKLIVSGSDDNIIRVWNSLVVSKPVAVFPGHDANIVAVEIMENQQTILSYSFDGVLKLWDTMNNKCLQTFKLKYPSFRIQGKSIEYGRKNIYPGPKRKPPDLLESGETSHCQEYFGIGDVVEMSESSRDNHAKVSLNIWERSNIILTCCNHIAIVKLIFTDPEIEKLTDMSTLSPPPLQNSVLIPSSWTKLDKSGRDNEGPFPRDIFKDPTDQLNFILYRDLLDADGAKSTINFKIAVLETKKLQMQTHVAKGAPYLALDLPEVEELKLSEDLPIPNRKNIKKIVEKTKMLLTDSSMRDTVFSEPSSSRTKSSRSSIIEFTY